MNFFENMCILCLVRNTDIRNVLSADDDGIVIQEKLNYIFSELVNFEPEIFICVDCLKDLNYVHKFKQKCSNNLIYLNDCMKRNTTGNKDCNYYLSTQTQYEFTEQVHNTAYASNIEIKDEVLEPQTQLRQENNVKDEVAIKVEPQDTYDDTNIHSDLVLNEMCSQVSKEIPLQKEVEDDDNCIVTREEVYIGVSNTEKEMVKEEFELNKDEININCDPLLLTNAGPPTAIISEGPLQTPHKSTKPRPKKQFPCTTCTQVFQQRAHLTAHTRTHTHPYRCATCPKAFPCAASLAAHARTHTRTRQCATCGKVFSDTSSLIRHRRTHTGLKPYACTVCLKTFSQSNHLTQHTRTHTGERPYACGVCARAFISRGRLVEHARTHTKDKPYRCQQCEYRCSTGGGLRGHVKRMHTSKQKQS